ncbi:MAG: glycosyltransferase family 2 protein [Acidobacteriota bacterium]
MTRNTSAAIDLTLVVPVHDEVGNIGPLLDEVGLALDPLDVDYELVVVDDGSTDGTLEQLNRRVSDWSRLRVIRLAGRHGQTAALQAGFDHARGEVIATMDGDLQNDPRDLIRLLDRLDEGYDAVVGWRRHRRDGLLFRRIPSWLANLLVRWVTGQRFRDLGCGIKAFRRDVARRLRLTSDFHRLMPVVMALDGSRCVEIEVRHRPRTWGRSKYGLERTWQVLLDLGLVLVLAWLRRTEARAEAHVEQDDVDSHGVDPLATGSWTREQVDRWTASIQRPLRQFGRIGTALLLVAAVLIATGLASRALLGPTAFTSLAVAATIALVIGSASLGLGFVAELARSRRHSKPPYTIGTILGEDHRTPEPEAIS